MFDPYYKWLGILPKDQPPTHYRLLGLEPFESDQDVIESAADRQMGFVRQYQSGEHADAAARILNELAAARLCLQKPAAKNSYDLNLRKQSSQSSDAPIVEFQGIDEPDISPRQSNQKPNRLIATVCGVAALVVIAVFIAMRQRPSTSGNDRPAGSNLAAIMQPEAAPAIDEPEHPDNAAKPAAKNESPDESPDEAPPVAPPAADIQDAAPPVAEEAPPDDRRCPQPSSRRRSESCWKQATILPGWRARPRSRKRSRS